MMEHAISQSQLGQVPAQRAEQGLGQPGQPGQSGQPGQHYRSMVLITDIGSVDPDDTFALIMAATSPTINLRGVIASHHYPEKKAKIAKLILTEIGKEHIKVYQGQGIKQKSNPKEYTDDDRKIFQEQNSHFPKFFGNPTENTWFPDFARAYYEAYGSDVMDGMRIEPEQGKDFLNQILREYSPKNRLIVLCIAPPHDLLTIDLALYQNMELYVMGGGFEDLRTIYSMSYRKMDQYEIKNVGYNFGICPEIVGQLLKNLSVTGQKAVIISPELVRRNEIIVPLSLYNQWAESLDKLVGKRKRLSEAVMTDWIYSNRGNRLRDHKNLCDPLAYILCENGLYEGIDFEMTVNENSFCGNYLQSQNMLGIQLSQNPNVRLVTNFNKVDIHRDILLKIQSVLF